MNLLTLAIETSNPSAEGGTPGVAVGRLRRDGRGVEVAEVLGVEPLRSVARHDDDLLPAIDRLWTRLADTGAVGPKRALDLLAVSVGPGGFTGLRVAVAAVKMMAETLDAGCVAVPSASVVARRVPASFPRPFAVLLASKRETSIATVFRETSAATRDPGRRVGEIAAQDIASLGVRGLIADRFLPDSIRAEAERLGLVMATPVFDPAACLEAAAGLPVVDAAGLAPVYGREPEAVRKWRELHGPARERDPAQ